MRMLNFDGFSPSWALQTRIGASTAIPAAMASMGLIWLFAFPDRWNHAVGGAAIFWALNLFWDALRDLVEFWPWRHERHFYRPNPTAMVGARMEHRPVATIIPFRKRDN